MGSERVDVEYRTGLEFSLSFLSEVICDDTTLLM